ncbi:hypothetical protein E2C01_100552 [Portunus trituberculatus]|uniref:Uncharacterized protein n=1 Tax=Portunus trituberculatus TaxID=210409 RepID=A0A5B7K3B0_PORTR|nr:hypothetical protein [Portunus trituberculatus]
MVPLYHGGPLEYERMVPLYHGGPLEYDEYKVKTSDYHCGIVC